MNVITCEKLKRKNMVHNRRIEDSTRPGDG